MLLLLNCHYVLFLLTCSIQWPQQVYGRTSSVMLAETWAQPPSSALLLPPQIHVPSKCSQIKKGNRPAQQRIVRVRAEQHWYNKENLPHETFTSMPPLLHLDFCLKRLIVLYKVIWKRQEKHLPSPLLSSDRMCSYLAFF